MARTLAVMTGHVGNMVMDTSTSLATLINTWLNDKYRDISKRCLWSALIDNNYTLPTVANTAEYDLPADFDEEVFVADITNGRRLIRQNEGNWWRNEYSSYQAGAIQGGDPYRYVILKEAGHLFLDPTPTSVVTIAMPYKKIITELTSATSPVILDIDIIMELGAVSEAFAYKRQFQKATYYLQRYELELSRRIGQERSAINQQAQFMPAGPDESRDTRRLTGDRSYDSI